MPKLSLVSSEIRVHCARLAFHFFAIHSVFINVWAEDVCHLFKLLLKSLKFRNLLKPD